MSANLHAFEVYLRGVHSRVKLDGMELKGVRNVEVWQGMEGPPSIRLELIAREVTSIPEGDAK